jgi:hypothetical protein
VRNHRDQSLTPKPASRAGSRCSSPSTTPAAKPSAANFKGTTIAGATTANGMWTELDNFREHGVRPAGSVAQFRAAGCTAGWSAGTSRPKSKPTSSSRSLRAFRTGNYEIKPIVQQLLAKPALFRCRRLRQRRRDRGRHDQVAPRDDAPDDLVFQPPYPQPDRQPARALPEQLYSTGIIQRLLMPAGLPIFFLQRRGRLPGLLPGAGVQPPVVQLQHHHPALQVSQTVAHRAEWSTAPRRRPVHFPATEHRDLGAQQRIFQRPLRPVRARAGTRSNTSCPKRIDSDRFNYFYNDVFLDNLPAADWTYEWQNYLSTNNLTEVKIPLEKLLNAIMYSPEFQTF